jgi:hypothetical protein
MTPETTDDEQARAAETLRAFDAAQRLDADFAHLRTWDRSSGPDPYELAPLPGSSHMVGALRGADSIVVLDGAMNEVQRLPAPASPIALAVAEDGAIHVAGELGRHLARFVWKDGKLVPAGLWNLDDIRGVRGMAAGRGGWVYVAEEREGRLIALRLEHRGAVDRVADRRDIGKCRGPVRVARVGERLLANCLLDHRLNIYRLEASGVPSDAPPDVIVHDGPMWSFAAAPTDAGLLIAAGGVEDHPLDRTIGAFGYIDSFLYLYRLDDGARPVRREAAINLSELGVVTPKAIALRAEPLAVTVAGYGSDKLIELSFPAGTASAPLVHTEDFVPGANAVIAVDGEQFAFPNPLLDAWVVAKPGAAPLVFPVAGPRSLHGTDRDAGLSVPSPLDPRVRIGEALFFTTWMAPFNHAEGALSRFTCETCHYEGYVDGRTHHTGREAIHAVTKPLLGLFNNRPHFSRALDPDLTAVVFNEFRVAGAKSGHDPWFALSVREVPWIERLGATDAMLSPVALRQALMSFLIAFQHRPNPGVVERSRWSERERRGAELFRDRCETCHEARLASDLPQSRAPFEQWEHLVMSPSGAIVWAKDVHEKTGVIPYVHEKGARIPSLRRLYKKHPYFTNGSADTLDDVVARARFLPEGFRHDATSNAGFAATPLDSARSGDSAAAESQLDDPSRRALLDFLQLL